MTENNKTPNQDAGKNSTKANTSGRSGKKRGKKKAGSSKPETKSETKSDTKANTSSQNTSKRTNDTMTTSADANAAAKDVAHTQTESQVAAAVPPAPAQAAPSSGKGLGWLALFISFIALCGAGYAWYQTAVNARLSGGEQSNRIANIEQRVDDFGTQQSGVSGLIDEISKRVSSSETGVVDQVSQVKQLVSSSESGLVSQISEVKQQIAKTESAVGEQISEVKQQIAKSESAVGEQIRTIRSETEQQQKLVTDQVAAADSGLQEQTAAFRSEFDQLAGSIDSLRSELGTSISGWALREIEHLLVMANQRLQLGSAASDAQTTLAALQIADQRLKELDDPKLLATRQALSGEIAALSAIAPADLTAVSSKLGLLSATLGDLPMKGVSTPDGPVMPEGSGEPAGANAQEKIANAGRSFFSDLAGLVQVEKGGQPVLPIIAPEVQSLQRAQGQLILESAQVALVRQQADIYSERMGAAESWVGNYIVGDSPLTTSWLEQLSEIKAVPIAVTYPDISASLAALRSVLAAEG